MSDAPAVPRSSPRARHSPRHRALAPALILTVLLGSALSGCTDDKKADTAPKPTPSGPSATSGKTKVVVVVTRVAGPLRQSARAQLAEAVAKPLQAYVDGAWLGSDQTAAFASFTQGAAERAQGDKALLTAAGLSTEGPVTATALHANLAVATHKGTAQGVTARVHLVFAAGASGDTTVSLDGRMMLTPDGGSWKVFGYDVGRSDHGGVS